MKQITLTRPFGKLDYLIIKLLEQKSEQPIDYERESYKLGELLFNEIPAATADRLIVRYFEDYYQSIPGDVIERVQRALQKRENR